MWQNKIRDFLLAGVSESWQTALIKSPWFYFASLYFAASALFSAIPESWTLLHTQIGWIRLRKQPGIRQ